MRAADWDERYSERQQWSSEPNALVAELLGGLPPGDAVDLAAGEGRHALWLAGRGWRVTAVDFSAVGLERGRGQAGADRVTWAQADVTRWAAEPASLDLVLVAYLHLPEDVLSRSTRWLSPGGALVVVGHALRNLTEGVGGPSDPGLLHTLDQLRAASAGLEVERCEEVVRATDDGDAIDAVLVARRPVG